MSTRSGLVVLHLASHSVFAMPNVACTLNAKQVSMWTFVAHMNSTDWHDE